MKINLFIILVLSLFAGPVKGEDPFEIHLVKDIVDYCADPVLIAQGFTITGNPNIKGMKISFSDVYMSGEDQLVYTGKLTQSQPTPGTLELTGSTDKKDYEEALNTIQYVNSKSNPTLGTRKITISLNDVDYLPATEHFYRFVSLPGISWSGAQADAKSDSRMYYGLRGYLTTITSEVENVFINKKTKGVGWIGASDSLSEGKWRWVTGPEGLEDDGLGLRFWNGTGIQAKRDPVNFGLIPGAYQNWDSETPEPNDSNGEDYAHITIYPDSPSKSYKWNDFSNQGSSDVNSPFYPLGYLIEFGGYPGEPALKLSATLDLKVNTLNVKTEAIGAICEGEQITLNQSDDSSIPATYLWSSSDPSLTLSSTSSSNPVATPKKTTIYTLNVSRGGCSKTAEFKVPVIPDPNVRFSIDSQTCYGYNLDVAYTGDPVAPTSKYTWIFGGDTIASGTGLSKVLIPLGLNNLPASRSLTLIVDHEGCSNQKTISGILVKPELSPWKVTNSELCLYDTFEFSIPAFNQSLKYNWNFGDGATKSGNAVTHKYDQPGKYDIQLIATNSDNCSNTARIKEMVFAMPVPSAKFSMDRSIVSNAEPTVIFSNSSVGGDNYEWDFGDGGTSSEINPSHNYIGTGFHKVLLAVSNQYNCSDTISTKVMVEFSHIFAPTAFSPNSPDEKDREFKLFAEGILDQGYHLTILSRWNDLVFEVNGEIKGWDGKMKNGKWAPTGTYLWVLNFTDFLDRKHQQSGSVTLVY